MGKKTQINEFAKELVRLTESNEDYNFHSLELTYHVGHRKGFCTKTVMRAILKGKDTDERVQAVISLYNSCKEPKSITEDKSGKEKQAIIESVREDLIAYINTAFNKLSSAY